MTSLSVIALMSPLTLFSSICSELLWLTEVLNGEPWMNRWALMKNGFSWVYTGCEYRWWNWGCHKLLWAHYSLIMKETTGSRPFTQTHSQNHNNQYMKNWKISRQSKALQALSLQPHSSNHRHRFLFFRIPQEARNAFSLSIDLYMFYFKTTLWRMAV